MCLIGRAGASPTSLTTWAPCLNFSTRFFFTVTSRHFTGHNTARASPKKRGSVAPLSLTRQGKSGSAERWRASETAEDD